jgi:hypothetical protein
MTGPFADGYSDGLHGRNDWAHLHTEGRALAKYLDGKACGEQDRNAGALDPVELVSP